MTGFRLDLGRKGRLAAPGDTTNLLKRQAVYAIYVAIVFLLLFVYGYTV